ncbi:VanZ family protein [Arenimonas daejeonensis]|uniref:VanZ family protein n=1 Tax=Arenimonas daejeonensis TaxID=370777 RepID=UPI0011BE94F8|nr:VanZ family protein [Arenimonas daejeonensis]
MRDFARPRLWLGIWIFGWALCIALSLLPPIELDAPPDSDKLGHFLAYAMLSAWAVMIFRTRRAQVLAALGLIALGIGLEFAQAQLTSTRLGDPRDALANTLGVLAGLALGFTPAAALVQHLDRRLPR